MSDSKADIYLMDENINDIFERKIEVGAVIQFNLLQRLIEEFIKRQKAINDKVNNLEIKINSIQVNPIEPSIGDENLLKYFEDSNINFELENDFNFNKESKEDANNKSSNYLQFNKDKENDNKNDDNKNDYNKNDDKNENNNMKEDKNADNNMKEDKNVNKKEKIQIENPNSNNLNGQYHKLSTRMDKLEMFIKEFTKKMLNSNVETKVNINQLKKDISELKKNDNKIKQIEKKISKKDINLNNNNLNSLKKEKLSENEKKDDNINENTALIKMLNKKVELMENREKELMENIGKEYEEGINQLKKEIEELNNMVSLDKNNYIDFVKEINANLNEMKNKHNNDISSLNNLIKGNIKDVKNEFNNSIEQNYKKIKEMIIEVSENAKNNNNASNNNNTNYMAAAKVNNEKLNNMNLELKNYINKSTSDTEKYLKSIINNLGIDNIKKDLLNLHQEINDKLTKSDLDYIDIKLNEFETKLNNENLKIDMVKKDVDICNDTCTKSVEMIEYLSGQVIQAYQPDLEKEKKEEMIKKLNSVNDKDLQSFLNKSEFDKEIKNIYKKIEQTLEIEGENYKFIQHIESRLKFFITQNELRTMEQCIMSLIEELKNEIPRKFMEKTEIIKNLKILELQIKNIYECCPNLLHMKENDNWLLAKKPINNYLCASCESFIGDLKNKNTYVPWNKIPSHDSKKYRMGNGFSRMLQLVNSDLMKSAEKVNNNLTIKIDDKKTNYDILKQLPRIGSQISMRHLNNPHNTFSLINSDNVENRLNNSADGMENLEATNNNSNNNFSSNSNNNPEIDGQEKNIKSIRGSYSKNSDKENSPKLVKIIKKTKKEKKDNN